MEKDNTNKVLEPRETHKPMNPTIFDLPEKVLVEDIAPYLECKDLINFRSCSPKSKELVDILFTGIHELEVLHPETKLPEVVLRCRFLRRLSLKYLNWLKDDELHEILNNNPFLEGVAIEYCPQITSKGLMPLAFSCNNIKYLNLNGTSFADTFLLAFARTGKKLIFLGISNCKQISSISLCAFLVKQPDLRVIFMEHIAFDISPSLAIIASVCNNLTHLYVRKSFIGDKNTLQAIADNCKELDELFFNSNPPHVTREFKKKFQREHHIMTMVPCVGECRDHLDDQDALSIESCSDDGCPTNISEYSFEIV